MGSGITPREVKAFIIQSLALENQNIDEIPDDMPLFEGGLGLDSIDTLELAMALRKRFAIEWTDEANLKAQLHSPQAIAHFISNATQTRP